MTDNGTNKIVYNYTDEIWRFDLADMVDYENSNKREQ